MEEVLKNLFGIIVILIPLIFTGLSSRNLSIKKGRKGLEGFLLGFFLLFLGLSIVFLLPTKNDYQPEKPLTKRILFGFIRLLIVFILYISIWLNIILVSKDLVENGNSVVELFTQWGSLIIVLGPIMCVWVLRGSSNFFKLR